MGPKDVMKMVAQPVLLLITYLLSRFTEPSTWAAVVGYVAFNEFHKVLPDTLTNGIVNFGVAAATLLAIILQEGRISANAVRMALHKELLQSMALAHMATSDTVQARPISQPPQFIITTALLAYAQANAPAWAMGYIDRYVAGAAPKVVAALINGGYTIIPTPVTKLEEDHELEI